MRRKHIISVFVVVFIFSIGVISDNLFCASVQADEPEPTIQYIEVPVSEPPVVKYITQTEYIYVPYEPAEPSYTDDDLFCMAVAIYQEAGGNACSDETRIKMGNVVLNRVNDPRFPNTIREVLLQPWQWGTLSSTGIQFPIRAANEAEAHAVSRAYDCARRVLEGEALCDSSVVFAAEFPQGNGTFEHVDGIYFCY